MSQKMPQKSMPPPKTPTRKRKPSTISIPASQMPQSLSQEAISSHHDLPLLTPDPIRKTGHFNNSDASRSLHRRRRDTSNVLSRESGMPEPSTLSQSLGYLQSHSTLLFQRLSFNIVIMLMNMLVILYFLSLLVNGPVRQRLQLFGDGIGQAPSSNIHINLMHSFLVKLSHFSSKHLFTNSSTQNLIITNAHVLKYYVYFLFVAFGDVICVICSWVKPRLAGGMLGSLALSSLVYLALLRFCFGVNSTPDAWLIMVAPLYAIGLISIVLHVAHMVFAMYEDRMAKRIAVKKAH